MQIEAAKARQVKKPDNVEIERRFLVKRLPDNLAQYKSSRLVSGFIIIADDEYYRARNSGETYSMAYKKGMGQVRTEIEMPITKNMFEAFWNITNPEYRSDKTRYYIPYYGHTIELSVYHGALNGFANAEIETARKDEKLKLPDWFGPEITDNKLLTNNLGKPAKIVLEEAARLLRQ